MKFLPGNAQHIGARSSQQDSFGFADLDNAAFIAHGGFLAIVCDGMGGMEHGDAASRTAVHAFLEAYQLKTPEETIPAALERSTRFANEQVLVLARHLGLVEGIGTTLVAAALKDASLYFVSVGDSGLFHTTDGSVWTVNRPHVYANVLEMLVARGEITQETASAHPERESLTSFIGAEVLMEIDRNTEPWPLGDGDTILLASDGMFKTLAPEEIQACLRGNPAAWPEALVQQTLAKHREFQDNVTVVSVTVESEVHESMPRTVLLGPPAPMPTGQYEQRTTTRALPRTVQIPFEPPPLPMVPAGSELPFPPASPQLRLETPIPPPLGSALGSAPRAAGPPQMPTAIFRAPIMQPPTLPSSVMASPGPPNVMAKASSGTRGVVWLVVAGLALAAAAGGGWWFLSHRASSSPTSIPVGTVPHEQEPRDPSKPAPTEGPLPQEEPLPTGVERKVPVPLDEKQSRPKQKMREKN